MTQIRDLLNIIGDYKHGNQGYYSGSLSFSYYDREKQSHITIKNDTFLFNNLDDIQKEIEKTTPLGKIFDIHISAR